MISDIHYINGVKQYSSTKASSPITVSLLLVCPISNNQSDNKDISFFLGVTMFEYGKNPKPG